MHGDGPSGSIGDSEFLDQLRDYSGFKELVICLQNSGSGILFHFSNKLLIPNKILFCALFSNLIIFGMITLPFYIASSLCVLASVLLILS
jgi:hypothetical protein